MLEIIDNNELLISPDWFRTLSRSREFSSILENGARNLSDKEVRLVYQRIQSDTVTTLTADDFTKWDTFTRIIRRRTEEIDGSNHSTAGITKRDPDREKKVLRATSDYDNYVHKILEEMS